MGAGHLSCCGKPRATRAKGNIRSHTEVLVEANTGSAYSSTTESVAFYNPTKETAESAMTSSRKLYMNQCPFSSEQHFEEDGFKKPVVKQLVLAAPHRL